MAQTQKKKQAGDEYARHQKTLMSSVQRLRGWIGSDPTKLPELVDALNALTAHRLLGHAYAVAAPDAQDAVKRSAEVLRAFGPIGPYTTAEDVVRCGTALVHLAAVQVAARLPEAAGTTVGSWEALREQVAGLQIEPRLETVTVVWALSCTARAALAGGDVALANAYADAALGRLAESGLREDPSAVYLSLDTDRLAADARWAAGRPEESLGFLHAAKDRHDRVADGRLVEPGRYGTALVERLVEPLFGLHRDLADRLAGVGEADLGLVTRRDLIETLRGLEERLGGPVRLQLAAALTDLTGDLVAVERFAEAEVVAEEAVTRTKVPLCAGGPRLLAAVALAQVQTASGRAEETVAVLPPVLVAEGDVAGPVAQLVAQEALAEALRVSGDEEAATALEQQGTGGLGSDVGPDAGVGPASDRARGVVSRGRSVVSWSALKPFEAYGDATGAGAGSPDTAGWLAAEREAAHRVEVERLEQAGRDAEKRRAAEEQAVRVAAAEKELAERARAEERRHEAARRAATEEAEQQDRKGRREQRLREHQVEVDRREALERAERRRSSQDRVAELQAVARSAAEDRELAHRQAELAELELAEGALADRGPEREAVVTRGPGPGPHRVPLVESALDPQPEPVPELEPDVPPETDVGPETEPDVQPGPELDVQRQPDAQPESGVQPESELQLEPGVQPEPEPEPGDLDLARQTLAGARAQGDRKATRAATERLVEVLRGRVEGDLTAYGPTLRAALEDLSSARLRGGDLFGSRAAAKEAKNLAKALGR